MNNITLDPIFQIPLTGKEEITSELEHTWSLDKYHVNLVKEGDKLFFQVFDLYKKLIKEGEVSPIKIDENTNLPMEMWIWCLKQCEPILSNDFIPEFCPLKVQWSFGDINVKLLKLKDNKLMWSYLDSHLNKNFYIPFNEIAIVPSKNCHPETVLKIRKIIDKEENLHLLNDFKITFLDNQIYFFRNINHQNMNIECKKMRLNFDLIRMSLKIFATNVSLLIVQRYLDKNVLTSFQGMKDLTVVTCGIFSGLSGVALFGYSEGIKYVKSCLSNKIVSKENVFNLKKQIENRIGNSKSLKDIFCIEIEPISVESKIDPRVHVSKFIWGVTMCTYRGTTGDHALALVEGINDGFYPENTIKIGSYFRHKIEFTGLDVRNDIFPLERLFEYETRSEIWLRTSEKIKSMIDFVELHKDDPVSFSEYGCDSIFSKDSHSCFTWLREQLKIADIYLSKSIFGFFITRTTHYTKDPKEYKYCPVVIQI